jgi:hypothetical protein
MAQGKVYDYYNGLPTWARGIVVVGGLVVGYIAVNAIIKKINQNKVDAAAQQEINTASGDLNSVIAGGTNPTLNNSELEAMSSAIIESSNGCGTDTNMMYNTFSKIKNDADILSFIKVFGLRKKTRCPFTNDTMESFWSSYTTPMSLSAMVNSELDTTEIQKINDGFLAKGMKYQF